MPCLSPSEGAFPPDASLHCVQMVVMWASCRGTHILGPGFLPSRGGAGLTREGSSTSAEHEVQGHGFQKRGASTAQARRGQPARPSPGVTTKGHLGPCVETLLLCHISPRVLDGLAPLLRPRLQGRTDLVLDRGPDTGQRLRLGLLLTLMLSFLTCAVEPVSVVRIGERASRAQHSRGRCHLPAALSPAPRTARGPGGSAGIFVGC